LIDKKVNASLTKAITKTKKYKKTKTKQKKITTKTKLKSVGPSDNEKM